MDYEEKIVQLLNSADKANVALAFAIAEGMPDIDLGRCLSDFRVFCKLIWGGEPIQLEVEEVVKFNETRIEYLDYPSTAGFFSEVSYDLSRVLEKGRLKISMKIDDQRDLNSLPESFQQFTYLDKLSLSGLNLIMFPLGLKYFKQLKDLDLSRNYLGDRISTSWWMNDDWRDWHEEITVFPEEVMKELPQLQKLNLSYNYLSELPDSIQYLSSLQELRDGNKITSRT